MVIPIVFRRKRSGNTLHALERKPPTTLATMRTSSMRMLGTPTTPVVKRMECGGKTGRACFGFYDMAGNVWEWAQDCYGDYSNSRVTDPTGPSSGSFRVFRGGGWARLAQYCRSAFRYGGGAGGRRSDLGFRLVRTQS